MKLISYGSAWEQQTGGLYCAGWQNGCATTRLGDLAALDLDPVYSSDKTQLSLDLQADALNWLLGQLVQRNPQARFVLVGYSLGGLVASYWVARSPQQDGLYQRVQSLVLIESPVGGIPAAGPFLDGCSLSIETVSCAFWDVVLRQKFGTTILGQLRLESVSTSIVGSLLVTPTKVPVTSIESTADYLVNAPTAVPLFDIINGTVNAVVGKGAQQWGRISRHADKQLGAHGLLSTPTANLIAIDRVNTNHGEPLQHCQTVQWVNEAIGGTSLGCSVASTPGGIWVSPDDGKTIVGALHFAAHAYVSGTQVNHVSLTAWWPSLGPANGPWIVACQLYTPSYDDVYECDWNFSGAPAGDISISFDVYDNAGHVKYAPNGVRTVHYTPGGTAPTPTAVATPPPGGVPAPPTLVSPVNGSGWPQTQDVTLSWSTAGVQSYTELWGDPYGTLTFGGWNARTSLHIGQMWPGTYSWHVKAANSLGQQSDWSPTWTFSIGVPPPTNTPVPLADPCAGATNGPSLYSNSSTQGPCHTFAPGDYPDLSAYGLDQNVSSLRDPSGAYHVTLFDQPGMSGTPGYFDNDVVPLLGYWNDRARSLRVERHGVTNCSPGVNGIVLYRDVNYSTAGGCLFVTANMPDLTGTTFERAISSLQFRGTNSGASQLRLYAEPNYQSLCGTYWQDQSDLRSCAGQAMSVQILPFTPPPPIPTPPGTSFSGNIAPQAYLYPTGTGAVVDGNLATEWVGGHGPSAATVSLSWAGPATIHRIVVWDRSTNSTDINGINSLGLAFSDGTVATNIDMISAGPRCVDITFPDKTVTWVSVFPWDSSGNNGYREIEVWATSGQQYSNNTCVNPRSVLPVSGAFSPPPVVATPFPASTPIPGQDLVVSAVASESSDGQAHDANNPYLIPVDAQYRTVWVKAGAYASAPAWNGSSGGTVRFTASGSVQIDGVLSVDSRGYRGGPGVVGASGGVQGESYTGLGTSASAANAGGGGGGAGADSGGGGGGYGASGQPPQNGPDIPPVSGGTTYGDASLTSLYLGSGGGSSGAQSANFGGPGGTGGGAISIRADRIGVTGRVSANGGDGQSAGSAADPRGGGGGSGGSIFLHANTLDLGANLVTSLGGQGGYGTRSNTALPASGGPGGVGRIHVEYSQSLSGSTNPAADVTVFQAVPTATPTATALPTATPGLPLTLDFVGAQNGVASGGAFYQGDSIDLVIGITNRSSAPLNLTGSWVTYDSTGTKVAALSLDNTPLTVSPGSVLLALRSTVPATLQPGSYTVTGSVSSALSSPSRSTSFTVTKPPPPPNDNMNAPPILNALPAHFTVDTRGATAQNGEPMPASTNCIGPANNTVWYRIQLPVRTAVNLSTLGSNFNTSVSVWQGTGPFNSPGVTCSNGVGGTQVSFTAEAGVAYTVQIGGIPTGGSALGGSLVIDITGTAIPPTLTPTATPTSTGTPTVTPTPYPLPNVGVQVSPNGGTLQTNITARDANCAQGNNQLQSLVFSRLTNATVDVATTPLTAVTSVPATVHLPNRPSSIPLIVHQVTSGQAATVELVVRDGCGDWPTFIGGGPAVFQPTGPNPSAASPAGAAPLVTATPSHSATATSTPPHSATPIR